jgi:chromosome partitioning protein
MTFSTYELSIAQGEPVLLYDLKCTGSQAYLKLASEVIQREHRLRAA